MIIDGLETALRYWEDYWFISKMVAISGGMHHRDPSVAQSLLSGPELHFHEFRNLLLHIHEGPVDIGRFIPFKAAEDNRMSILESFPMTLCYWTALSRRVFHISSEIHERLQGLDLRDLRWKDLLWPFRSFAITLDKPILGWKENPCDCIILSSYSLQLEDGATRIIEFRLLNKEGGGYIPLSNLEKEAVERLVKRKQENTFMAHCIKFEERQKRNPFNTLFGISLDDLADVPLLETSNGPLQKTLFRLSNATNETTTRIAGEVAKMVASLCVFFSVLPPKEVENLSEWRKLGTRRPRGIRAITSESNVLEIGQVQKISELSHAARRKATPETQFSDDQLEMVFSEKSPHHRMAHFRRPPGSAPNAPRTIKVKEAFIHKEKLPPGSLPLGNQTTLNE